MNGPGPNEFLTLQEIVAAARRNLRAQEPPGAGFDRFPDDAGVDAFLRHPGPRWHGGGSMTNRRVLLPDD